MKIVKPIFIIGLARSGTTILYELFTKHNDTAYFERYSSKFYNKPWLFSLVPLVLKYQKLRYKIIRPRPSEGWVWNRFYDPLEYLDETKVNDSIKNYYQKIIETELKAFSAKRFVSKSPRHCLRIRWLNAMFPNSYYIIIWRNPKAVVNSFYQKIKRMQGVRPPIKFVHGYKGDAIEIIEKFGKNVTKFEACVNYYKYYKDTLVKDLSVIKDKTIEIKYDELIKSPRDVIKLLYDFTELKWYEGLEEKIPLELEQKNDEKWKNLPSEQQQILEIAFSDEA